MVERCLEVIEVSCGRWEVEEGVKGLGRWCSGCALYLCSV